MHNLVWGWAEILPTEQTEWFDPCKSINRFTFNIVSFVLAFFISFAAIFSYCFYANILEFSQYLISILQLILEVHDKNFILQLENDRWNVVAIKRLFI